MPAEREGVMAAKINRKGGWSARHDGSVAASIELDAENIEACKETASLLHAMIRGHHGIAVANEIFSQQLVRKRQIANNKNYLLLNTALQRLGSTSMSIDQVAAELAKENDTMPPESQELRWGPTGTTSQSTMAKQIRRLIKDSFRQ
jgi:hypothetical protein